jgi:hypothetical protein
MYSKYKYKFLIKIIMNNIFTRLDSLFYEYSHNKDANFKYIVTEWASLCQTTNIFSDNAKTGFHYLNALVYNQMCRNCNDEKALLWIKKFSKAWLEKTELPLFDENCWTETCK